VVVRALHDAASYAPSPLTTLEPYALRVKVVHGNKSIDGKNKQKQPYPWLGIGVEYGVYYRSLLRAMKQRTIPEHAIVTQS